MLAARNGNAPIAKILLDSGADFKAKNIVSSEKKALSCNIYGSLIFRQNVTNQFPECNHMYIAFVVALPLLFMSGECYTHSCLLLYNKSQHGKTILMFGVQSGVIEVIHMLYSRGVNFEVNAVDNVSANLQTRFAVRS